MVPFGRDAISCTSCARQLSARVLSHIAERLKDLHASGYVHRDIKPGNIMWLPRKKRWTLIDFGCAARTGTQAPTGFSLFYVAPEALSAFVIGAKSLVVSEALDAWSLGVLAIELFTGDSVFDHMHTKQDVRSFSICRPSTCTFHFLDVSKCRPV